MAAPFGEYPFGLSDVKIASRTSAGVYGTNVDVTSAQMLSGNLRIQSAENTGDDQITALAARILAGEGRMRFSGAAIETLEVITGLVSASTVASPNRVRKLRFVGGTRLPYFGVAGFGLAEEGNGDQELFMAKCKVTGDITLVMNEYGSFQVLEFPFTCLSDESYGIMNIVQHETALAVAVVPPANIGTI